MKIWCTGESGFLARSLSRCLPPKHEIVNQLGADYYDYFRSYNSGMKGYVKEIDIFDPTLPVLISRSEADCIVHTAAMVGDRRCNEFPASALRINIEGTLHVINAANEVGIPIIFTELLSPPWGVSTYVTSKWAAGDLVKIHAKKFFRLLLPNLYGIGDLNGPIGQLFDTAFMKQEMATIDMDPDIQKPWLYIDDLCDAISAILDKIDDAPNGGYGLPCGKPHTLTEVIEKFDKMDLTPVYEIHPEKDMFGASQLNSGKDVFKDTFGWEPKTSLTEGLKLIKKSYGK
jgi:nucleoside-diphosphate-sugar epimerase